MANVKTYSKVKDGSKQLSTNFKVREFACNDGSDTILIDSDLVTILQKIRDKFGKSVTINSAYRTTTYNAKIGGASNSQHTKGKAADIVISGVSISEIAKAAEEFGAKGIGLYNNKGFVHVDVRDSNKYFWVYSKSGALSSVSTFGATTSTASVDNSSYIKKFQTWLNTNYSSGLTADGKYGTKTKTAAIKAYQKILGVTADGAFGSKTKNAVKTLKSGSTGNAVYIVQGMLYCLGYDPNGFDGKFGSGCVAALKEFQGDNNLTQDGQAGKGTFTKLFV